jgi:ATP-binding cassette subfamily F protein uup
VILIDAERVSMTRPGRPLLDDVSVTVSSGDRLGIVGINGTGKSTLLRILAGTLEPESGTVRRGRDTRVAVLDQHPHLGVGTVREAVGEGWEAESVLDRLGMGPLLDTPVAELSGGQAKRTALARTLLAECDLLLLDEPTNHLDIDAIAWLEERLASFRGAIVIITHDRHVLDRVTNRVLELERGASYLHDGGYQGYLEGKAEREEHAAKAESVRKNLARRELAWLRRGAPARTSKAKARIRTATEITSVQQEKTARDDDLDLHVDVPRLGDQVIDLEGVGHAYAGDAPLFERLDLSLHRRERLGLVGVNGSGKSTLLDIMAKRIEPTSGHVVWGSTVQLGYYDQLGRELDPGQRVREAMTPGGGEPDWRVGRLLDRFWFDSDSQWAPIELLSGGERRRLQLLLVLAERPNVLLLDEPTNDLDLDTLRTLEDFLDGWPGALVVVSHDRAFLERTVDDVVVIEGGKAGRLPGGYEAWETRRKEQWRGGSLRSQERPAGPKKRAPKASKPDGPSAGTLRHRVKQLEKQMRPLERRRDKLHEALEGEQDYERIGDLGAELTSVEQGLTELEDAWLDLSQQLER